VDAQGTAFMCTAAGTPGTWTSLSNRFFDVRAYGAIGDGSSHPLSQRFATLAAAQTVYPFATALTDELDWAAIQAALNAASAAGGGTVSVPHGTYYISNTLALGSGTQLSGAGRGSTILRGHPGAYPGKTFPYGATHYATLCLCNVHHASVEHLTVDHATNRTEANGIAVVIDGAFNSPGNMYVSTYCTIEDCEVLGYNSHQYLIWNMRGQHIKILYNHVDGGIPGYDSSSVQEGIETMGGYDVLIQGNTARNVGSAGILLESDPQNVANGDHVGTRVLGNYIEASQDGIRFALVASGPGQVANAQDVHIKDNVMRTVWRGGVVLTSGDRPDQAVAITNLQIAGNSICGVGGASAPEAGIWLWSEGVNTQCTNVVVYGNMIETATSYTPAAAYGIYVHNYANVVIKDNAVNGQFS
jgi:polygalacturonase